ncbi:hypothetical protein NDU88_003467 [Pleurodeles waltl]|uniref:Uncharacterized protein n=1 Tax=Pleurodeles waltl TaxID=8319 RepID=A0AAV7L404_PLEWA|nr:hypothetical protein NDU88_003467 [Pleurodeles waltl]
MRLSLPWHHKETPRAERSPVPELHYLATSSEPLFLKSGRETGLHVAERGLQGREATPCLFRAKAKGTRATTEAPPFCDLSVPLRPLRGGNRPEDM